MNDSNVDSALARCAPLWLALAIVSCGYDPLVPASDHEGSSSTGLGESTDSSESSSADDTTAAAEESTSGSTESSTTDATSSSTSSSESTGPDEVLPFSPAPISYWSLDDATVGVATALDVLGANDAALFGVEPGVEAVVAEGVELDGVSSYLEVPHDDTLEPGDEGTMALWVRFAELPSIAGHFVSLMDKGGFSTDYSLLADPSEDKLTFYVGQSVSVASTSTIVLDTWMHVAVTYRMNDAIRVYVDGGLEGSTPVGVRQTDAQPLRIGEGSTFTDRFLEGRIDEVAVWNVALDDEAISELYDRGIAGENLAGP